MKMHKLVRLILLATAIGLAASMTFNSQATTVTPTQDTTTVLHNPLMNFVKYTGCYSDGTFDHPDWIFGDPRIATYGNIIYMRCRWVDLEPTEGNYVWNNSATFKNLIAGVKAQGFRMAFRVLCQDGYQTNSSTPPYVISAIKTAGRNPWSLTSTNFPNVLDPIWQTKYSAFVKAFGAVFNDPTVTDFVDCNGLGLWGEGNLVGIPTHAQEVTYYDWHLGVWASAFSNVIMAANWCTFGTNTLATDYTYTYSKYHALMRSDGMGSQYPTAAQLNFINSYFPKTPMIIEECYGVHNGAGWATDPAVIAALGSNPTLQAYMGFLLDQTFQYHGMIMDFNEDAVWTDTYPTLCARFVANIGYRLRPTTITFPSTTPTGSPMTINHTWVNDGCGALPNTNPHWTDPATGTGKYRVAFALFPSGQSTPSQVVIDGASEPGNWINGTSTPNTANITWTVASGNYDLGIAIVDTTLTNAPSIQMAVRGLTQRNGWSILGAVSVTSATGVVFYNNFYYAGTASQSLTKGSYTIPQLAAKGVPNDWASSVTIPAGWMVTMYSDDNMSGTSWTLTSSQPLFNSLTPSADNQMSSGTISDTTGVIFYDSFNYAGTASQTLAKGTYTMAQLAAKGVPNDWACSVKIPIGWTVIMYQNDNFAGTSWTMTSDTPLFNSLSPSGDNQMSSCKIQ